MSTSIDLQTDFTPVSDDSESPSGVSRVTKVSIVVPLYNERDGITDLLEGLKDLESTLGEYYDFQFVFVDDGSDDGTADLLSEATLPYSQYRVVRHHVNRGIAAAIHTGIFHSDTDIVVSIDADGSYDALQLEEMLPLFTPEVDLLTASPYHPAGRVENVAPWRLWISKQASSLYRCTMQRKLYCYTSCFRIYRRSRFADLATKNTGFVGIAELLWIADARGLAIVEHPAVLRTRVTGKSKMKIFRAALQHFKLLGTIALHRLTYRFVNENDPRHTP